MVASSSQFVHIPARSFKDELSIFGWLSFLVGLSSVVVALYILFFKLTWSLDRLKRDHHYRLRFILSLLLLLDRACQCTAYVTWYYISALETNMAQLLQEYVIRASPAPQNIQEDYRNQYKMINTIEVSSHLIHMETVYAMMVFLLFLTLDRYKRIHMVLKGSRLYYFFKFNIYFYTSMLVYLALTYTFDWIPLVNETEGKRLRYQTWFVTVLLAIRPLIQLIGLVTGMSTYYYFTMKLVLSSIRGVEFKWADIRQILFTKWKKKTKHIAVESDDSTSSYSEMPSSLKVESIRTDMDMEWAEKQVDIIHAQKLFVALKMISYLLVVISVDLLMLGAMLMANLDGFNNDDRAYNDTLLFISSWIVFHVLIIYELLDLFLKELKKANFVRQVQQAASKKVAQKMAALMTSDDQDAQASQSLQNTSLIASTNKWFIKKSRPLGNSHRQEGSNPSPSDISSASFGYSHAETSIVTK